MALASNARAAVARRVSAAPQGVIEAVLSVALIAWVLSGDQSDRAVLATALVACAGVALSGRYLTTGVIVTGAAYTLSFALGARGGPEVFAMPIVVGIATARGSRWMAGATAVWFLVLQVVIEISNERRWIDAVAFWLLVLGVAFGIGLALRRISTAGEAQRQATAEAVASQRRAIARDLHDTIAYSTTSIIMRAEQAKLRGVTDPDTDADLDFIITAGRNSLRDLRGMLEALRLNDESSVDPRPAWKVQPIDDVVAQRTQELRAHGFSVTSNVELDRDAMPDSVKDALAKVVVEATSNMIKHGDPSAGCSIMIEGDDNHVEALFVNRPSTSTDHRDDYQHLGLLGARERIESLGGVLQITSEAPRWVVRVEIPWKDWA